MDDIYGFRGTTIGSGLSRADWYSICSRHHPSMLDPDCEMCATGRYVNRWGQRLGALACRFAYPLWKWWVNRPNSRNRRHLERVFPRLREGGKST